MLSLFAFKVDNLLLTSCFSLSNSIISSFKFSIFSFRLSILFLFTSFFSIKISSWFFNLFIDSSFSSFSLWILFKFSVLFSKDLLILSSSSLFFLILFKDVSFCWFNKFISYSFLSITDFIEFIYSVSFSIDLSISSIWIVTSFEFFSNDDFSLSIFSSSLPKASYWAFTSLKSFSIFWISLI